MTTPEQFRRIEELFHEAEALPADERRPFLERACADDRVVFEQVELLLAQGDSDTALRALSEGVPRMLQPPPIAPVDHTGERVDSYRLVRVVGEGGMGVVYEAEQEEPVRRRVALKLIKWGMDSRQVVARFDSERQALAMMDHPHIARVFDAGTSEKGRPYFVMEYVDGVPITEFCDSSRLTTEQRLELFIQVCDGIQHAHQKGIIHRDIKPSNVMVTGSNGDTTPKIIDFGIAKAIEQRLTEKTVFTELGQVIGTPDYMSPEQAEFGGTDIDTRTDVYSLGVLLYEVLVGALPFDPKELRASGFDEARRKIREEEPSRPSERLKTPGELPTRSARRRNTDPVSLVRRLRGDLDWIAMRALEKDRGRRYSSASELAADIRRHLDDEPVLAGPPGAAYRLGKFARRNKGPLAAGAGMAAALMVALVAVTVGWVNAAHQRDEVAAARDESEAVTTFLADMLAEMEPGGQGKDVTVREVLDSASERIETDFVDIPLVEARLGHTIGRSYGALGDYDTARRHLERAEETRRRLLGKDDPLSLTAANDLATVFHDLGNYEQAETLFLETYETRRRVLGEEHDETLDSLNNLSTIYAEIGRYDEAEKLFRKIIEIDIRQLGEAHRKTLTASNNLGWIYSTLGRHEEAAELFERLLVVQRETLGNDDPDTTLSMTNLGKAYVRTGRAVEAEPLFVEVIEIRQRTLEADHPHTSTAINNLAGAYKGQGRLEEAEPLYREATDGYRRALGPDHPYTLTGTMNLCDLLNQMGRFEESLSLLEDGLARAREAYPSGHWRLGVFLGRYAAALGGAGRHAEAEPALKEAHALLIESLGAEDKRTTVVIQALVDLYDAWNKPSLAAEWRGKLSTGSS